LNFELEVDSEYQLPSKNLEQRKNGSAQARAPPNLNDQGVFNPISNDQNGLRTKSHFELTCHSKENTPSSIINFSVRNRLSENLATTIKNEFCTRSQTGTENNYDWQEHKHDECTCNTAHDGCNKTTQCPPNRATTHTLPFEALEMQGGDEQRLCSVACQTTEKRLENTLSWQDKEPFEHDLRARPKHHDSLYYTINEYQPFEENSCSDPIDNVPKMNRHRTVSNRHRTDSDRHRTDTVPTTY
jgi:hypothetical protein